MRNPWCVCRPLINFNYLFTIGNFMKDNFDKAFALVIKSEGGYVWDKDDAGGETNLGVTKGAWSSYQGRPILDGEMKALTVETVKPFYKKMYWDKVHGDELPSGVDYAVFDFAVNAGSGQSAKFLQRAVGANADGAIGPNTLRLVQDFEPETLLDNFTTQKEDFYNGIVERKPEQAKFLKGWMSRVAHVQTTAESMLA
jgi:lysozyme family protein